jgi:hypothetical protein
LTNIGRLKLKLKLKLELDPGNDDRQSLRTVGSVKKQLGRNFRNSTAGQLRIGPFPQWMD